MPLGTRIAAAGARGSSHQGAVQFSMELGLVAAGTRSPSHRKVDLYFELAPTRIQYER